MNLIIKKKNYSISNILFSLLLFFNLNVKDIYAGEKQRNKNSQSCAHVAGKSLVISSKLETKAEPILDSAISDFVSYFAAVNDKLLERTELIKLVSIALIAKEHVLLMGPPGNAKSLLAHNILGNITDAVSGKKSYYRIQMTPETTISETLGPISPKEILQSGKIVRQYFQGLLHSRNGFIDEIFDGGRNSRRNILGVMEERHHAQGPNIEKGITETIVAASNKYIDEVYEEAGNDGPRALLDRFAFNTYVPGEFEFVDSYVSLIRSAGNSNEKLPKFTFDQLDLIRDLVDKVNIPKHIAEMLSLLSYRMKEETESLEQASILTYKKKIRNGETPQPPYRSTKYHSPRTVAKSANILKAMVVYDYVIKNKSRLLTANFEDLKNLSVFFTLSGPKAATTQELLDKSPNPYEKSQLSAILLEADTYNKIYEDIYEEINSVLYSHTLSELINIDFTNFERKSSDERMKVYDQIVTGLAELSLEIGIKSLDKKQSEIEPEDIGLNAIQGLLMSILQTYFSKDQFSRAQQEIEGATDKILAEFKQKKKDKIDAISKLSEEKKRLEQNIAALSAERELFIEENKEHFLFKDFVFRNTTDVTDGKLLIPILIKDDNYVVWSSKRGNFFQNNTDSVLIKLTDDINETSNRMLRDAIATIASPLLAGYFEDENTMVVYHDLYQSKIDINEVTVTEKKLIARFQPIVHVDNQSKKVYIADFKDKTVKILNTENNDENLLTLKKFTKYEGNLTTDVNANVFFNFLNLGDPHNSFVVKNKLITLFENKDYFTVIELETGEVSLVSNLSVYLKYTTSMVGVDDAGFIYGHYKDSTTMHKHIVKMSSDSKDSFAVVKNILLNFDSEVFSAGHISTLNIDSDGQFAIVGYVDTESADNSAYYLHYLNTGKMLLKDPIINTNTRPISIKGLGDNLFMLISNEHNGESINGSFHIVKFYSSYHFEKLKEINKSIEVKTERVPEINQELTALGLKNDKNDQETSQQQDDTVDKTDN